MPDTIHINSAQEGRDLWQAQKGELAAGGVYLPDSIQMYMPDEWKRD